MPRVTPRRRPARPARDAHRIGRLEARLAVETDARRALADRLEALELRVESSESRLNEHDAFARGVVVAVEALETGAVGRRA